MLEHENRRSARAAWPAVPARGASEEPGEGKARAPGTGRHDGKSSRDAGADDSATSRERARTRDWPPTRGQRRQRLAVVRPLQGRWSRRVARPAQVRQASKALSGDQRVALTERASRGPSDVDK